MFKSPFSDESGLGLPGMQGVRLLPSELIPIEAVLMDRSQLPPGDLAQWGFEPLRNHDDAKPLATLSIAVDMASRHDLDFLEQNGERIGGFVFDDPHSDEWWVPVHRNGRIMIIVGDVTRLLNSTTVEEHRLLILDSWAGIARLAVRAYPDGVGTAAPGQ